jgi:hypothetical protein
MIGSLAPGLTGTDRQTPVGWSGARMSEAGRGRPLRRPPAVTRLIRHGIYPDAMSTWDWLYFVGPVRLPVQAPSA